ncbi:MAG TPA: DUF6065 family protein [Gemmataceae bacterium]|nr:DUF6065 family protein [Gemmataceae bacterium]
MKEAVGEEEKGAGSRSGAKEKMDAADAAGTAPKFSPSLPDLNTSQPVPPRVPTKSHFLIVTPPAPPYHPLHSRLSKTPRFHYGIRHAWHRLLPHGSLFCLEEEEPNMTVERIQFAPVFGADADFPPPYPAHRVMPNWYKEMPAENYAPGMQPPGEGTRTVKNCIPFLDAMTCGYIIPLAVDLKVTIGANGEFVGDAYPRNLVDVHTPQQVPGAPFENNYLLKFVNPWLIQTPPGYSTLFLPLLNRFQPGLMPLAGLVETDLFYRAVNFPTIVTVQPGTTFTWPRGTPLVQALPVKRAEFHSEFVPLNVEKYNETNEKTQHVPENYNFYRDNIWEKKAYR